MTNVLDIWKQKRLKIQNNNISVWKKDLNVPEFLIRQMSNVGLKTIFRPGLGKY